MAGTWVDALQRAVPTLGWTLAHFLWQGALIGFVAEVAIRASRTPQARYRWALAGLLAMAAAPLATFAWLRSGVAIVLAPAGAWSLRGAPFAWEYVAVAAWLTGVAALALRAAGGLVLVEAMRRSGAALPVAWDRRCEALRRKMGGVAAVLFAQSQAVAVPLVAGWLRPMVLIPAAALARLPAEELEALILHELAHLKRLDHLANLLQAVVETALFYHPSVWRLSGRMRVEREDCCDDLAVRAAGDAGLYVRALTGLERLRAEPTALLAANGGDLKRRAARILGLGATPPKAALSKSAAVLVLSLAAVALAHGPQVAAKPAPAAPAPPAPSAIAAAETPVPAPAGVATPDAPLTPTRPISLAQVTFPALLAAPAATGPLAAPPQPPGALAAPPAPLAPSSGDAAGPHILGPGPVIVSPLVVHGQPSTPPKPDVTLTVGEGEQSIAVWPARAWEREADGKVTMSCFVNAHGLAEHCRVIYESPQGQGFGAAAMAARASLLLKPTKGADGQPIAAEQIVALRFKPPPPSAGSSAVSPLIGGDRPFGQTGGGAGATRSGGFTGMAGGGAPREMHQVVVMDDPVWVKAPSWQDLQRAYPRRYAHGEEGFALLHCEVKSDGSLLHCFAAKQQPWGQGFAEAAQKIADRFRVSPEVMRYAPTDAPIVVDVPVRFPAPGAAPAAEVQAPVWIAGFDPEAAPKLFPPEAAARGVTSGVGFARCTVAPDGRLTACAPDGGDAGFAEAAVKIASTLKMNLWSSDAEPVVGGSIRVPIRLKLAGVAAGGSAGAGE